ncbi:carbohydrate-binding module family 20 domain-containing protein [Marinicrinis sediminis]|uniref:Alpha-amylase n=1 Tax=Marinicrinis sediminis TaxID=1652465 RepID=A0ABW5R7V1_9BACL
MKFGKKAVWSVILAAVMMLQTWGVVPIAEPPQQQVQAATNYGLPAQTKDGLIFHAWNWSFDSITNNLPAIAAAGFKSIQTSPIQGTKEPTMGGSYWWVLYQPTNFYIGNNQLGDRNQFKRLCEEAEQYGISIIVDVVANHTGNAGGGGLQYTPANNVDPAIKNNPYFWHEARGIENYNDRWQVTQWGIGLPDLNTSNQELQNMIINFLNDAISLGADGFRFDAAKHIELPNDPAGSNFWPRVFGSLNNANNLYLYGEVLQGGADNFAGYANYMSVTPSSYGHRIRNAVGHHSNKSVNNLVDYGSSGVSPSKLVTWVESHDTYANDGNESTYMSDWQLKMGWAMIAARSGTTSLFFNRPAGGGKFASSLGQPGDNLWKDPDVKAINQFHNAMVGQNEYMRTQGNEILIVDRGTKGTAIINLGGNAYIDSPTNLANGTYQNKASGGGTFTVSNGRLTGNLGGGQIAVLYESGVVTPGGDLTVHFYKPDGWGTPNMYYYDDSVTPTREGAAWPGVAMTSEGDGWYAYTINGWDQASVIFNSNGQQVPASQNPGYLVTQDAWIKDGVVTATKPGTTNPGNTVTVTFNIQNATTTWGQNVYLVGNTSELGNWNTAQALGPGSTTNYPTWTFTVDLPAGQAIEFKAIKKDANNNVQWQSGGNRTYTVSASNPVVNVSF